MRLVGMIIKPLKDADYSLVELRGERPTPHCKKHGAMNKFTPEIWRCCSTYKFEKVAGQSDKHPGKFKENNCLAGCEEVLNTSSSNDAHTKTDARFGGSGADDVLCADVPSSPVASQDNRGTSTDERCPSGATQSKDSESAVSDQDGAKPSTSVQPFDRKCPDSEPAGTGREGGKPSTSFVIPIRIPISAYEKCGVDRDAFLKRLEENASKFLPKGATLEIKRGHSFSSGKGEHSPSGDAGRGKSGVPQNLPLANPRPEESIVGWPRNEAEAAAWEKAKRSYIQNVTPEKAVRADERRKVLDEVEARIVFLEDAKKRYSTSSRHACDLLIREHRFMLGAMRK